MGLAGSKMLAKVASEEAKPAGLLLIEPGTERELLAPMSVRTLPGVGPATGEHLRRAGITKAVTPHTLRHAFITAALDAGVPLRDVQEAASHADPKNGD